MDPVVILSFMVKLMNLVPAMVQGVSGAIDAFTTGAAKVETMVKENRNPTDAEWDELNAVTDALMTSLFDDNK